jgi:hypothetical protein
MISRWLRNKITQWILADIEGRVKDLERHFITKRNAAGLPLETLADVPLKERKERSAQLRGMSMAQRKAHLEATDGGRNISNA